MARVMLVISLLFVACREHYTPKPRGYHRIDFPEKTYADFESGCPFEFQIPEYAEVEFKNNDEGEPCWFDLVFPSFNARLHMSYVPIQDESHFGQLVEDARTFAYTHMVIASAIDERRVEVPDDQMYGVYYDIRGNVASTTQFFVSDRMDHYLRGALYFNEQPRSDSIRPVVEFLRDDLDHLLQTLQWK